MGGKNIGVAEHMWSLQHVGIGQGMIMGRSVHNQRIERLWRDVYQGCLCLFYSIFTHLETCGVLDPSNELHLFVLHFIYQPRIQQSLNSFRQAYINHPLSSCANRSPAQLFFAGTIRYAQLQQTLPQVSLLSVYIIIHYVQWVYYASVCMRKRGIR